MIPPDNRHLALISEPSDPATPAEVSAVRDLMLEDERIETFLHEWLKDYLRGDRDGITDDDLVARLKIMADAALERVRTPEPEGLE